MIRPYLFRLPACTLPGFPFVISAQAVAGDRAEGLLLLGGVDAVEPDRVLMLGVIEHVQRIAVVNVDCLAGERVRLGRGGGQASVARITTRRGMAEGRYRFKSPGREMAGFARSAAAASSESVVRPFRKSVPLCCANAWAASTDSVLRPLR